MRECAGGVWSLLRGEAGLISFLCIIIVDQGLLHTRALWPSQFQNVLLDYPSPNASVSCAPRLTAASCIPFCNANNRIK